MEENAKKSTAQIIDTLLNTPGSRPVDPQLVAEASSRCPAFLLPAVLQLRHPHQAIDDAVAAQMVMRISLSLPDPSRTRLLLDPEGTGRYDNFYPTRQVAQTPTTNDAIDTFLSTYGNIDPAEEALLNRMIFNPVPDYAATLEREAPATREPRDEQDRLLDAFLDAPAHKPLHESVVAADESDLTEKEVVEEPVAVVEEPVAAAGEPVASPSAEGTAAKVREAGSTSPKAPAGSLLSESLAKIFIKQHNYKRAYEIISSLSLNYPEKSIYFADQLRFLHKLILNQEARERIENEKVNKK